jgi:hypothetical protein
MTSSAAAIQDTPIRPCEAKLVAWLRRQALAVQYGAVNATLAIEIQDGVPVSIRVASPAMIEERFR